MIWSSTKKQKPRRNTRWVEYKSEEHSKKFEILVDVQLLIQVLPNTNLVHYSNSLWNICVHAVMYIRRWPFFKILILPVIPNYISFCFDWITDIFFKISSSLVNSNYLENLSDFWANASGVPIQAYWLSVLALDAVGDSLTTWQTIRYRPCISFH